MKPVCVHYPETQCERYHISHAMLDSFSGDTAIQLFQPMHNKITCTWLSILHFHLYSTYMHVRCTMLKMSMHTCENFTITSVGVKRMSVLAMHTRFLTKPKTLMLKIGKTLKK